MYGNLGGAAMKAEGGPAGELADNLEFEPGDAEADAGAEGLGASFFGCEACGKTLGGIALAETICLFCRGVDAIEEARPVALNGAMDAVNLDQIDASSDDHACFQATRWRKRNGGESIVPLNDAKRFEQKRRRSNYLKANVATVLGIGCFKDGQRPCKSCTDLCWASVYR